MVWGIFTFIFLYTFAHLNFNPSLTSSPPNPASISYSHPKDEPPSFFGVHQHTPQFTELAKAPLRIYIPPAPPTKQDPLHDIWATDYHKEQLAKAEAEIQSEDRREYYKGLDCPVCAEEKPFDISRCPGIQELKKQECPVPAFDLTKCPGMRVGGSGIPPASDGPPSTLVPVAAENATTTRALISYAYEESPGARKNLAFFVNHVLHENADFMFILKGKTTVDQDILPKGKINVNIYKVQDVESTPSWPAVGNSTAKKCFQSALGLRAQIIGKDGAYGRKSLKDTYNQFILLNGGVRGPFIPKWSQDCWSEAFLSPLKAKVKLVGTALSCRKGSTPYINPGILATDREGLAALFGGNGIDEHGEKKGVEGCFVTEEKARIADGFPTKAMQAKGFETRVFDGRWRSMSE